MRLKPGVENPERADLTARRVEPEIQTSAVVAPGYAPAHGGRIAAGTEINGFLAAQNTAGKPVPGGLLKPELVQDGGKAAENAYASD